MAYEAERLINRRFGHLRLRLLRGLISHLFAALLGATATLLVTLLIRNI